MSKEKQIDKQDIIAKLAKDLADAWIVDLEGDPHDLSEALMFSDIASIAAEQLVEQGYIKQSGWISVEERLPDKGQEVLAYRGDFNGDMMNTYTYLGGLWEDDYGYRGSIEHEGITHWMPLPEAPKGGAE